MPTNKPDGAYTCDITFNTDAGENCVVVRDGKAYRGTWNRHTHSYVSIVHSYAGETEPRPAPAYWEKTIIAQLAEPEVPDWDGDRG